MAFHANASEKIVSDSTTGDSKTPSPCQSFTPGAADCRGRGSAARVRRGGGGASAETAAAHGGVGCGAERAAVCEGHENDSRGGLRALCAPHGARAALAGAGGALAHGPERALPARVWHRRGGGGVWQASDAARVRASDGMRATARPVPVVRVRRAAEARGGRGGTDRLSGPAHVRAEADHCCIASADKKSLQEVQVKGERRRHIQTFRARGLVMATSLS